MREQSNLVPGTPTTKAELVPILKDYVSHLDVQTRLQAYGTAVHVLTRPSADKNAKYYLLHLDAVKKQVVVSGFPSGKLQSASASYLKLEREIAKQAGSEAVLVSVDSVNKLRTAYPNYFLDTRLFIEAVNTAIQP